MATAFEKIMEGMKDVEAYLAGEREGFKVTVPAEVDVKSIRKGLNMTQARFSDTFGFSLDAVKNWECGRRMPEASARTLLTVIHRNPAAVIDALHPGAVRIAARKKGRVPKEFGAGKPSKPQAQTARSLATGRV